MRRCNVEMERQAQMTEERSLDDVFSSICSMELPLRERMAAFTAALPLHSWGQEFAAVYSRLIAQLDAAGAGSGSPAVGDPLPSFLLPDADGRLVRLEALLGAGPLIVSFNRGHWCQYCELELKAFASAHAEFARHGASVVSIMPERLAYLRQARARTGDAVLYLADVDNGYALDMGLVVWLGDEIRELYGRHGLDLETYQGNRMWFVPIPATYVIDAAGRIVARRVDPDFRTRMDVEDILTCLGSLR